MVCKRCGLCCYVESDCDTWKKANLTKEEIKKFVLSTATRKFTTHCTALEFKDGQATCIIEKMFGKAKKPQVCRDWGEDKCFFIKL